MILSRGHLWPVAAGGRIHSSPKISLSTQSTAFDFDIYTPTKQSFGSVINLLKSITGNQAIFTHRYITVVGYEKISPQEIFSDFFMDAYFEVV